MRFDIDQFREIADSLVRNKRRTLLTGFGVFWGLFMLLFMIGGGKGLKGLLSQNFDSFATNTVVAFATETSRAYKGFSEGRSWSMNLTDMERLRQMVPEIEYMSPMISRFGQLVEYGSYSYTGANLKGVYPEYSHIEEPSLKYGRYINQIDMDKCRKVCIIGKRVYQNLFPEGGDPCGKYIKVGSVYLQVVGVDVSTGSININGDATKSITIPLTLSQKLYNYGSQIDMLCYTGRGSIKMGTLDPKVRQIIARQHSFDPEDKEALMLLNTQDIFQIVDNLFRGLNFLIWLVGLGTLLAGCIGVSNIMMVTVKERTIEIGIRRAIGALPGEILGQILSESIALTLAAGSGGIVFSVLLLQIFEKAVGDGAAFQISFGTAVLAAALLAVLGAVAGLAPALRAMAIKPVDAMRDE